MSSSLSEPEQKKSQDPHVLLKFFNELWQGIARGILEGESGSERNTGDRMHLKKLLEGTESLASASNLETLKRR